MNLKNNELLDEAISDKFEDLKKLTPGSDEETKAVNNLEKLYKLSIDEIRLASETLDKVETRANAEKNELNKRSDDAKNRYIKLGLDVAGIVVPLAFYALWMKQGFEFEKTGTYTSGTFRGLFGRFKPTK